MSESVKHTSSSLGADAPTAGGESKRTKTSVDDNNITSFKQETDDEDSTTPPLPAAVSKDSQVFKQETDDEDEGPRPSVMTFTAAHDRFVRLQLLSTHTLYDLVAALCTYTPVGYEGSDGPDEHLWYVTYNGREYESSDIECVSPLRANQTRLDSLSLSDNCKLVLTYDYGTTSTYTLTFLGQRDMEDGEESDMFPRNDASNSMPSTYTKYVPPSINGEEPLNLDTACFDLQKWIFAEGSSVVVNLFQPGKKKNWGWMDNGSGGMMYLPVKPSNLTNYITYFNDSARLKPSGLEENGYPHYEWHSVVILPRSKLTNALRKYQDGEERGFCDANVVDDVLLVSGSNDLNAIFPKIAALAGFRKDAKVTKGWVTFTKRGNQCNLAICTGNSENHKAHAPKFTAFDGQDQHTPVEQPLIQVSGVEVRGLNDLFCVVEGLLRTL